MQIDIFPCTDGNSRGIGDFYILLCILPRRHILQPCDVIRLQLPRKANAVAEAKVSQMTEDCQLKLQDTLQKIINDSNGGMICIII